MTELVRPVSDDWDDSEAAAATTTLGQVVYASRVLGANRALANIGGGNTSAKDRGRPRRTREPVIWVKGSGSDLATATSANFTPLRLTEVLPLFERDEMTDEAMIAHLACCQLAPTAPRSSIETLLHAFIPAAYIHHTHPDAINVLACAEGGRELAAEFLGPGAAWIDYIRPSFTLAKQVGIAVRENPELELVVLAKHGLVVWGDTARAAYERTVAVCNQAAEFVNLRTTGKPRFGGARTANGLDDTTRRRTSPRDSADAARRGVVRAREDPGDRSVADGRRIRGLTSRPVANPGRAACPDHLVHTQRVPMWVEYDPASDAIEDLQGRLPAAADRYRADYRRYFTKNRVESDVMRDPDPRVVLIQNVGLVAVAPTLKAARISRDLYHRAIEVMAGAHGVSDFVSLTARESFAVEYWPLELYKLSLAPPPGELEGKVALVTGAAGGIGRAILRVLAGAGAAVVAFDIDGEGAAEAIAELGDQTLAVAGDVTSEQAIADAFAEAVNTFGGIDLVISNAGIAPQRPDRRDDAG